MYSIGASSGPSRRDVYFVAGYSLGETTSRVLFRAFVIETDEIETRQRVSITRSRHHITAIGHHTARLVSKIVSTSIVLPRSTCYIPHAGKLFGTGCGLCATREASFAVDRIHRRRYMTCELDQARVKMVFCRV
jgi:hypothetical protein